MYLISTSKKTVLSDFADLETKSTYLHANGESTDFQFNARRRVFVEVDKKATLAVMRIRENQRNASEIQRVRKLTIENAYSVCCAKTISNQIAIGQASGYVKLFDFRTTELVHRYPADQSHSGVLCLDYNCTDDYIAAVLESGKINIYGTKTKQKMETLNIDDHSTLARFHPCMRFHLAVASYTGTVTVYEMQTKRKIYNINDAHSAPCRDVSMCRSQPSLLVSVGYDCKINIFDIRRNKAQSSLGRLSYSHPLSTVALSECGTYFCAGNLKGELISYDIRSTKVPLAVRPVHEGCAVSRVAFVPIPVEEQHSSSFSSSTNTTVDAGTKATPVEPMSSDELLNTMETPPIKAAVVPPPTAPRAQRDSFCDFFDVHKYRGVERMSTRMSVVSRRDSFDWDAMQPKTTAGEDQRQGDRGLSPLNSANSTSESLQQTLSGPLRDRSNISDAQDTKLKQIAETDEQSELHEQTANCSVASSGAGSDKENPPTVNVEKRRLRMLSSSRNSTPHHAVAAASQAANLQRQPQAQSENENQNQHVDGDVDVRRELAELRESMEERFDKMDREFKWSAEKTTFQIFSQSANYWNQQLKNTQEIRDALAILLQTDRFTQEFMRLQQENQVLRAQVQKLLNEQEIDETSDA
ncbi:hypothetical protein KR222_001789 [Zaprionus bogoriensis]|nr:hypothetical protein KR222_001789 [Zaprionus bogoriensis]